MVQFQIEIFNLIMNFQISLLIRAKTISGASLQLMQLVVCQIEGAQNLESQRLCVKVKLKVKEKNFRMNQVFQDASAEGILFGQSGSCAMISTEFV